MHSDRRTFTARGRAALAATAFVASASTALAADETAITITGTKAGDFMLGQQMAQCAAHYDFIADQAKALGKPAAETHLRNVGRGWLLAGQFALTTGGSGKGAIAAETAKGIHATQTARLASIVELSGAAALPEIAAMRERDCDPLEPQQEAIVSALRQMR